MKISRLALLALGALASLVPMTSCNSNPDVFTFMTPEETDGPVTVRLMLNVASTRAGDLSTDAENKISIVNICIFDEGNTLESIHRNVLVSSGTPVDIKIYSSGSKKIYAVSAKQIFTAQVGWSITDFENKVFDSHLSNLRTSGDGYVMIGFSEYQQVEKSSGSDDIPESNKFSIDMHRLVAKTQLSYASVDVSGLGFSLGTPQFAVYQTSNLMRVVYSDSDVHSTYTDKDEDGTYDQYTVKNTDYIEASAGAFTADKCKYMPENYVVDPKSGNTTFMGVKVPLIPGKYYSYASDTQKLTSVDNSATVPATFYAVAIVDKVNGLADYAVDASSLSHKRVITFANETDANSYRDALNGGDSSGITVSQSETGMQAPRRKAEASSGLQFQTVTFNEGIAYYRINIGENVPTQVDGETVDVFKPRVLRNKYYKVQLNSIKNLGLPEESLLRPTDPEVDLDNQMSSWIETTFNVVEWTHVAQDVDL